MPRSTTVDIESALEMKNLQSMYQAYVPAFWASLEKPGLTVLNDERSNYEVQQDIPANFARTCDDSNQTLLLQHVLHWHPKNQNKHIAKK